MRHSGSRQLCVAVLFILYVCYTVFLMNKDAELCCSSACPWHRGKRLKHRPEWTCWQTIASSCITRQGPVQTKWKTWETGEPCTNSIEALQLTVVYDSPTNDHKRIEQNNCKKKNRKLFTCDYSRIEKPDYIVHTELSWTAAALYIASASLSDWTLFISLDG